MANFDEQYSPDNFPHDFPLEYGIVKAADEECDGVYYVAVVREEDGICLPDEYLVVTENSTAISKNAKNYGRQEKTDSTLYLYDLNDPNSGHYIVEYEVARYKRHHGACDTESHEMLDISRIAMEYHPEYFGEIPAPIHTPWGQTTRYKKLLPGVVWIETDECVECLAVSYTIWSNDFSSTTAQCAQFTPEDVQEGIHDGMAYAFFSNKDWCLPAFELWNDSEAIHSSIVYERLMNAIWRLHPEYAAAWNIREQAGLNDVPSTFLKSLGMDVEVRRGAEKAITLSEDTEINFWNI